MNSRPPSRRRLCGPHALGSALVFLGGFLPATLLLSSCGPQRPETPSLTVLFTGTLLGKAEPCGCFTGDFGGLVRISQYVSQIKLQSEQPVLFFDLGDLLFDKSQLNSLELHQYPLKARMMMEALTAAGCDAWCPGDYDFSNGLPLLKELDQATPYPFLLANVNEVKTGKPVFQEWTTITAGALKVGVFGLLGRELNNPAAASASIDLHVARTLSRPRLGLRVRDPVEVARALVPVIRKQCDYVILLGHVGNAEAKAIAAAVPGIDLILCAHFTQRDYISERDPVNGTAIALCKIKGARVERVDIYGDPRSPEQVDNSFRAEVRQYIAEDEQEAAWMEERVRETKDPVQMSQMLQIKARLKNKKDAYAKAEDVDGGDLYEHYSVLIDHFVGSNPKVDELVRTYHEDVHKLWTDFGPGPRVPFREDNPRANYVGYQACIQCHPTQTRFWKEETQHARAYATLEATHQEVDIECVQCHTVGWRQPGGFTAPSGAKPIGFENVQCENCHGPGSFHALGGENSVLPGSLARNPDEKTCLACHNDEHDKRFSFAQDLPIVAWPPPPPADPALQAARESGLAALQARLAGGEEWVRALVGQLLLRLGRVADAVQTLQPFETVPEGNLIGRYLLAEARLDLKQYREAEDLARDILDESFDFQNAYPVLARSLLAQGKSQEALTFLLDAVSRFPLRLDLLIMLGREIFQDRGKDAFLAWLKLQAASSPQSIGGLIRVARKVLGDKFDETVLEEPQPEEEEGALFDPFQNK
ncbi:MAG: UshA-like (seleno)protein [Planctomycetota bacterium]